MGVFSDFSNWASSEAHALGRGMSSFATGAVNLAKYGLHVPIGVTHEISSGVQGLGKSASSAFQSAAHEGQIAFGAGSSAFVAASHEASLAVQGVSKNVGSLGSSLGSSFAWPLAIVAGVVAFAIIKR